MIRLLGLFFLVYLGYLFLRAAIRLGGSRPHLPPEKTQRGEEMVLDPACGTYLPRGDAVTKRVGGELYYFCSEKCRDAYPDKAGNG